MTSCALESVIPSTKGGAVTGSGIEHRIPSSALALTDHILNFSADTDIVLITFFSHGCHL